ncbi:MAG: oligosaccharide flippase family protein [Clostridia bacterium]
MQKFLKDKKTREYPLKNRLLGGAVVLAAGSIVAKIIGALYRIPLTNILGAEGMGMYQLVFPVYALFMTLSTAGVPTALSRIVAERRASGEPTKKYLMVALLMLTTLSVAAAILTVGLSKTLAAWQGNEATAIGYAVIAPSIFFVGVSAGLRGWFQGGMNMAPTAISNIISQIAKLAFGIALAILLKPKGLIYAVSGALIGITISEFISMIYLGLRYFFDRNRGVKECLRISKSEARGMFSVAFPIAFVAILLPLSSFFDSLIIVNVLKWSGAAIAYATASYGLLSGPVVSLVNMPIVIIMSLAVVIVPAVSVSRVEHNIGAILDKSRLSIKLTYFVGIPCALFFIVFARQILGLIYPALSASELLTASNLLMITASNVVLLSAMQIYISLLQALDRTKYAVLSLVVAIIVKIVLNVALVKFVGILGAAVASVAMSAVALTMVNIFFIKLTSLHLEKNVGINLMVGVIMAMVAVGISFAIKKPLVAVLVGFTVCVILYLWLALLFNVLTKDDMNCLPLGKYLIKLRRFVRFWEYKGEHDGS